MRNRVTFGVRIPVEGWAPIGVPPPDFDYLSQLATRAELLGYDCLHASDHLINWIGSTPTHTAPTRYLSLGTYESWTTVSALASMTKRIKLSNVVLCNLFRNPALLAKMASTLDLISGGRFVLAVGAGWFREECNQYGLDWFPYSERIDRLQESILVMKALWTKKTASFEGKYYRLREAVLEPKPITKPHPPIWLGGSSDQIIRMVAREADGWDIGVSLSPEALKAKLELLGENCRKISRNPEVIRIARPSMVVLSRREGESMDLVRAKAKDLGISTESFLERYLVGTPSQIASRMREFIEAGVQHFTLYFERDLQDLDTFASEVMPRIR
jgi:probable F420-dependent oxidoreductase